MANQIITSFDPTHPSGLTTFRILGLAPDQLQKIIGISGVFFQKNTSTFSCSYDLCKTITDRFKLNVQYLKDLESVIKRYDSRADIEVTYLNGANKIRVTFNPKKFFQVPSQWLFESIEYIGDYKSFNLSPIEGHRIQEYRDKVYPYLSIRFDEQASTLIANELTRRNDMGYFSKAEDDDTIVSPLSLPARPYHKAAARFTLECFKRGYGPVIALDMGLGKTYLAVLVSQLKGAKKILWVTKASLSLNLEIEIRKLCGDSAMRMQGIRPSQDQVKDILMGKYRHYIISYEIIGRWLEEKNDKDEVVSSVQPWVSILNMMGFDMCVMDEAHNTKNIESQRSVACRNLKIPNTMLLTGTPLVNRPMELFPLLNIIMPERYHSQSRFASVHVGSGNEAKNPEKLKDELLPIMFRREKKDVEKELPPIIRIPHQVTIKGDDLDRYKLALKNVFRTQKGFEIDISSFLAQMVRCLQIVADAKVAASVELAYEAEEETGHKVLIFSKFKSSLQNIAQSLNCDYIDGDVNEYDRMRIVKDFQENPNTRFLALSIAIGSEGLTLTAAHTVIFNDLMWTPKDHDQAEARAWGRLSDMHGCNAYYVIAEGTIDGFVLGLLEEKRSLVREVIDGIKGHVSRDMSIAAELLLKLKGNTF